MSVIINKWIANPGGLTPVQGTPTGTVNGVNTAFQLNQGAPSAASYVVLFIDGRPLIQGTDYTLSGINITMSVAPAFGQHLYSFYFKD